VTSRLRPGKSLSFFYSVLHGPHLHRHVINKTDPAGGMLQEQVAPILHGFSASRQVPVVPQILRLEVLVHRQVDGIVGGIRGGCSCRGFAAGLFYVGGAAKTHGGARGEPQEEGGAAVALR